MKNDQQNRSIELLVRLVTSSMSLFIELFINLYIGLFIVLVIVLGFSPANSAASDANATSAPPYQGIQLTAQQQAYNIYSSYTNAYVVHDPKQQWKIADFIEGKLSYENLLSQPASKITATGETYWLVMIVDNQHSSSQWRLVFEHGRTDSIAAVVLPLANEQALRGDSDYNRKILHAGLNSNPKQRQIAGLGYTLPITLPAKRSSVILIRVNSYLYEGGLYVSLEEAQYNTSNSFLYQSFVLALLGLMLSMSIYNLFIFLVTRDITYFWYSIVAASLTLTWASYYGLTWSLFNWREPQRHIAIFSQISITIFTLFFTRSFLNLRHHFRQFDNSFWFCAAYLVALSVATFFVHAVYIFLAFWLITLLGTVLIIIVSISCIVKGYRPARFLVGGQLLVAIGTFQTGLAILGLLPYEDPAPHQFTAMSAAEMVLLSMALADRINQLRNEKRIAEQANELKSSFLAMMSHEIRTPLNGLLSMIKLLAKSGLNQHQKSYVESIDYSGNALLSMLNGLLDYSKLENQHIKLESIAFDPRLLVESLVMLMWARASEKGLTLSTKLDSKLPPQLVGDPNRLRQVLLNLISNAIKFTQRGSIHVGVSECSRNHQTITLEFSVTDTGIGIAHEDQDKIFDVFTQADASITRRFGGTGLGLSICKRLLQLMKGELKVTSEPDKGSRFSFTLELPYKAERQSIQESPKTKSTTTAALKVLLIDDVQLNRVAAAGLLEHEGHTVITAASAAEGLKLLQQQPVDIVLMDIHMPDMDGLTATQHIRQINDPAKAQIPVIALTANTDIKQRAEYLQSGINGIISKPLDVDELLTTIQSLVKPHTPSSR